MRFELFFSEYRQAWGVRYNNGLTICFNPKLEQLIDAFNFDLKETFLHVISASPFESEAL